MCECKCVCVLVVWGGGVSLVSLLNIKQLEVIKYLGSAGSLWILILPFPSVSQISLSFPLLSVSLFFPSSFSPRPSPYTHMIPVSLPVCGYPLTFSFFGPYSCMISSPPPCFQFIWPCLWRSHSHLTGGPLCLLELSVMEGDERSWPILSCHVMHRVGTSSVTSPLSQQATEFTTLPPAMSNIQVDQQTDRLLNK